MRNKLFLGILLFVFITGVTFVFSPRTAQVANDPYELVFHGLKGKGVVRIRLTEDDNISEEIQRFLADNDTGWRIIIRQLSLGETAPSIEIFGEDDSYKLSVWRGEAVLGFWKTKKSYRKKNRSRFSCKTGGFDYRKCPKHRGRIRL